MKAKTASLWAKIAAAGIALAGEAMIGIGWLPGLKPVDVLELSAFVAVVFVTVDLNLLAEKVFHWAPSTPAPAKDATLPGVPG